MRPCPCVCVYVCVCDTRKVATLEGKLASMEKNSGAGKAIADVQQGIKNLEQVSECVCVCLRGCVFVFYVSLRARVVCAAIKSF